MIAIGIDPGTNTGLAMVVNERISQMIKTDFWGAYDGICAIKPDELDVVIIEISKTTHVWHLREGQSKAEAAAIGQKVQVAREQGKLLAKRLIARGYTVETVEPLSKSGYPPTWLNNKGKLKAEPFRRMTGWTGPCDEHTIDAALIALSAKPVRVPQQ